MKNIPNLPTMKFIGKEEFSETDATGQMRFENGVFYVSTDQDSDPEFTVDATGVIALTIGDFTTAAAPVVPPVTAVTPKKGGSGADTMKGGVSSDFFDGGEGNDYLDGGDGDDQLIGGMGDDKLVGGAGADSLDGGQGKDNLDGGLGNDTLVGGSEDDKLSGGDGNDNLDGGDGNDNLNGDVGNDFLFGDTGNDTLNGGVGIDTIIGGEGNDKLVGGDGNDEMNGNDGNDTVDGGKGDDLVWADSGNDVLNGGEGNDFLRGGLGKDDMSGGAGNDTFMFVAANDSSVDKAGRDVIKDFKHGEDKIDLSGLFHKIDPVAVSGTTTGTTSGATTVNTVSDTAKMYNGHSYLLSDAGTWDVVQAQAVSLGGNLVAINDKAEQDWVVSTFTTPGNALWTGYNDAAVEGQFQWVGADPAASTLAVYTNWQDGEPNNYGVTPGEDYAYITPDTGKWIDSGSGMTVQGVIEIAPVASNAKVYNGHTYQLSQAATWQDAQAEAQKLGGNLVTINDQAEQDWLNTNIIEPTNAHLWTGFNDQKTEGSFEWASGEKSTYTNWQSGEPNNFGAGEDYVNVNKDLDGRWFDSDDTTVMQGIIEIPASTTAPAPAPMVIEPTFIGAAAFSATDATNQVRFEKGTLYVSTNADAQAEFAVDLTGVKTLVVDDFIM